MHHGSERDRSPGLYHEFQFGEGKGNGRSDLVVAHRDTGANQRSIYREGKLAGHARHQRVANRAGQARILLATAAME